VRAAHLVRATLDDLGLVAAVKTSGAKGMHIFVPVIPSTTVDDAASATRAIAERAAALDPSIATTAFVKDERGGKVFIDATRGGGGATVVAAYSPRLRAGAPVSWPCTWDDLDQINPADFTIRNALERLDGADPWANNHPAPQALPQDLVDEGSAISGGRVQAMHEGLRRARARRKDEQ
jgi:DNA primase